MLFENKLIEENKLLTDNLLQTQQKLLQAEEKIRHLEEEIQSLTSITPKWSLSPFFKICINNLFFSKPYMVTSKFILKNVIFKINFRCDRG